VSARLSIFLCSCLLPLAGAAEPLPSGSTWLSDDLKTRQEDPAINPGMLWVDAGEALWAEPGGGSQKSCADCHGDAAESMKGVATRYPAIDDMSGDLLNLEGRINRCRSRHQEAEPYAYETDELLGLSAFVAYQSRGLPMNVATDGPAAPYYQAGKAFFDRRQGQMNLACSNCHDDHAGARLRGDVISHGLGNGYPAYRLEWQAMGSLHRRLRACSLGVRAVQFDYGSANYLALELYLAKRAEGVPIETPAMRK
jgi:L-cysteine S-thiosulfotransferase